MNRAQGQPPGRGRVAGREQHFARVALALVLAMVGTVQLARAQFRNELPQPAYYAAVNQF